MSAPSSIVRFIPVSKFPKDLKNFRGLRPLRVCTFLYCQIHSWVQIDRTSQKFSGGFAPSESSLSSTVRFILGGKFTGDLKNFRGALPPRSLHLPLLSDSFLGANFQEISKIFGGFAPLEYETASTSSIFKFVPRGKCSRNFQNFLCLCPQSS